MGQWRFGMHGQRIVLVHMADIIAVKIDHLSSRIASTPAVGTVKIIEDRPSDKFLLFRLDDSAVGKTILKNYGKSKLPADYSFRGMLAGTFSVLFNTNMDCVETKCIAMGNNICEFEVREKSKINFSDEKIKQQFTT